MLHLYLVLTLATSCSNNVGTYDGCELSQVNVLAADDSNQGLPPGTIGGGTRNVPPQYTKGLWQAIALPGVAVEEGAIAFD
ncbi:MAG: hypothetical protein AB4042_22175 [Leptolyngbyaceae cyanobacterium]